MTTGHSLAKLLLTGKPATLLKATGITVLAFLLSAILVSPLSMSLLTLFSPPEKQDFSVSDFYAQLADKRPVRTLDPNIILIDIDRGGREEIADVLDIVSLCDTRAVGLDIMFADHRPTDTHLLEALSSVPGLVLPMELESTDGESFSVAEMPWFHESIDAHYGAANLPGAYIGSTIREFPVGFRTERGTVRSFPAAVAATADPEALKTLDARGNRNEVIDYPSREFTVIPAEELFDRAETINGKVVLIGSLSDKADIHATPVDSRMSGLMIHAYALSTILESRYYTDVPESKEWIPAFVLSWLLILSSLSLSIKARGIVMRLVQCAILYLSVHIGYSLYADHRIILNFSYTILMITFTFFAADIWNGCHALAMNLSDLRKRVRKRRQAFG